MKQHQINKAYTALSRLANLQMPIRDAHNLYMLAEKIRPAYNFELEQESKFIEKHGGKIDKNTGVLTFKDKETEDAFKDDIVELNGLDVDITIEPITIDIESLGNQRISTIDIMCLEGFVVFE